jgi:hypothetical protein
MLNLQEIRPSDLKAEEKQSILQHAIDLHLLGSDEVDDPGFDIVAKGSNEMEHILRITDDGDNVGVVYIFPFRAVTHYFEMTILIHDRFRGKHLTALSVGAVERYMTDHHQKPLSLCASVRDHNPLKQELTAFLLRHGYSYSSMHRMFIKSIA